MSVAAVPVSVRLVTVFTKSSLWMVPVAVAVPIDVPALALLSVTVKPSFWSAALSPATRTVTILLVSPAAKLTVPDGSALPKKSVAEAGAVPDPVTGPLPVLIWLVALERLSSAPRMAADSPVVVTRNGARGGEVLSTVPV